LFLYAIEEKKISGNIDELSQKFVKNPANWKLNKKNVKCERFVFNVPLKFCNCFCLN
jgi:hypothetical protein